MLAFSSCSKQELISACEHRFLVIVDSLVAGCGLWGSRASVAVACGQLIVVGTGLAAPQRVGSSRTKIEPMSPSLAGRFLPLSHQETPSHPS